MLFAFVAVHSSCDSKSSRLLFGMCQLPFKDELLLALLLVDASMELNFVQRLVWLKATPQCQGQQLLELVFLDAFAEKITCLGQTQLGFPSLVGWLDGVKHFVMWEGFFVAVGHMFLPLDGQTMRIWATLT